MLEYFVGRGAVEDAREGIRGQEDGDKPQRDEHDHRQRTQPLAQTAATRATLVERKLLCIRILLYGLVLWRRSARRRNRGRGILRRGLGGYPLHLHLHKPLLLTQHALGLLLRGLKKQVHAGLLNRSN